MPRFIARVLVSLAFVAVVATIVQGGVAHAEAGSIAVSWNAPTTNTNGTPLTNLAGFKVYWGTAPGNYTSSATIMNPGLATYVVDSLTPNTYHFVVTAINSSGTESSFSNPVSKTIP